MPFPEPLLERLNTIISTSETKQSSLIPLLIDIQNEFGHLSNESMEEAAKMLEISPSSVQNVATFYTMFFTEPVGKHVVWVCRTLSCALRGAEHVEHYVCDKLG
ncbi:MAG: NAD(P)H-dependent oxidoreductase subunit E, partial [Bacteroidetes bacterium]|nr:NAD(P)H-dependent oxidoreductase subunit E [Bacteroidota bacterium]